MFSPDLPPAQGLAAAVASGARSFALRGGWLVSALCMLVAKIRMTQPVRVVCGR